MSNPKLLYNPFTDEQLAQMKKVMVACEFGSRSELLRTAWDSYYGLLMEILEKEQ